MSDSKKKFDAFRLRLNDSDSREKSVDDALKILESTYFTSDDAQAELEKSRKNPDKHFKNISKKIEAQKSKGQDREEVLDEVLFLLENARLNSDDAQRVKRKRRTFHAWLLIILGIVFIGAAATMIVFDPPLWLKGPTLYYFNPYDGITQSDVIAVLMIGLGTFFMLLAFRELRFK
ncbi:hypothetical protein CYPRO_1046 [Cyclonatronum proteinivorum]|uniref:Uncharacterized protein n=1 Tax=Cyclonatronum proteinivorum TaxID=1457365 RepID=A0A345UIL4_9BACT|nr:hypothetical protein [Cyclonatronum proteinivorum]AXJ00316.1 hypothetical protein CYPRO_1046 [Cyclonatronum proteinivorum]